MGLEVRARHSIISGHVKAASRVDPKASPSQHPYPCGICSLMGNRRDALFTKKVVSCFRIINRVLIGQREACRKSNICRSTDTAIIINAIAMQRFVMPEPTPLRSFSAFYPKIRDFMSAVQLPSSLRSRLSIFEGSGGNAAKINIMRTPHLEYPYHVLKPGSPLLALLSFRSFVLYFFELHILTSNAMPHT